MGDIASSNNGLQRRHRARLRLLLRPVHLDRVRVEHAQRHEVDVRLYGPAVQRDVRKRAQQVRGHGEGARMLSSPCAAVLYGIETTLPTHGTRTLLWSMVVNAW